MPVEHTADIQELMLSTFDANAAQFDALVDEMSLPVVPPEMETGNALVDKLGPLIDRFLGRTLASGDYLLTVPIILHGRVYQVVHFYIDEDIPGRDGVVKSIAFRQQPDSLRSFYFSYRPDRADLAVYDFDQKQDTREWGANVSRTEIVEPPILFQPRLAANVLDDYSWVLEQLQERLSEGHVEQIIDGLSE